MPISAILDASCATSEFKADVRLYAARGHADRIRTVYRAPTVKVVRLLTHLLAREAELVIDAVRITARSGCSDFVGTIEVETPEGIRAFDFVWDCRWRAEQEGWTDCFGFPDQMRAASEFDWQCFSVWRETEVEEPEGDGLAVIGGR